jgi:hypothetical protein
VLTIAFGDRSDRPCDPSQVASNSPSLWGRGKCSVYACGARSMGAVESITSADPGKQERREKRLRQRVLDIGPSERPCCWLVIACFSFERFAILPLL